MDDFGSLLTDMLEGIERKTKLLKMMLPQNIGGPSSSIFRSETVMNVRLADAIVALNNKCQDKSSAIKCTDGGESYGFEQTASSTAMGIVNERKSTTILIGSGPREARITVAEGSSANGKRVVVGRLYKETPEINLAEVNVDKTATIDTISEASSQWESVVPALKPVTDILSVEVLENSSSAFEPLSGDQSACERRTEFFIPFKNTLSETELQKYNNKKPVCRSYDWKTRKMVYEGVEMVGFDKHGVYCKASRLSKFFDVGWDDVIPPFTKLTKDDFQNLTIENLMKYPRGLYVVGVVLA
eukprot:501879_1